MVAGDVVVGNGAGVNTSLTFQPAATVEVCLMTYGVSTAWCYLTNGVVNSKVNISILNPAETVMPKLFINNSNYLYVDPQTSGIALYSGIQIK